MTSFINPRDRMGAIPVSASVRMANRGPQIPESQRIDLPRTYEEPARRRFDARLGCWVPVPMRRHKPGRPQRTPPLPQGHGRKVFDVFDALTGARFGSIRGDAITQAISMAGQWAVACGFTPRDVRVVECF